MVSAGGVTTYQQLFPAKVFDPIKPALLLPEITDTSKWYQGKHHYSDPENQYIFDYVATATYGSISYNTKLVNVKGFQVLLGSARSQVERKNHLPRHSRGRAPALAMRGCFTTCPMSVRRT